jgi:RNA polymerase sigma-70 factor (ECF subfamily)
LFSYTLQWSQFITEHEHRLLAYLNRLLHCPYLAEDALQDTFVRLCSMSLQQNEDVEKHKSFCYQVAHNIAIDIIRKRNKQVLLNSDAAEFIMQVDENSDLETELFQLQVKSRLRQAISKLPVRHQSIWQDYHDGFVKQKDIAEKYNVSPTLVNFIIKDIMQFCSAELRMDFA